MNRKAWVIEGAVIAYRYAMNENEELFFVICRNLQRYWNERTRCV